MAKSLCHYLIISWGLIRRNENTGSKRMHILKAFEMYSLAGFQKVCTNIYSNQHIRESLFLDILSNWILPIFTIFNHLLGKNYYFILTLTRILWLPLRFLFYHMLLGHLYFFSMNCLFVSPAHVSISVFVFVTLICNIF